jgi:hypothetical protein
VVDVLALGLRRVPAAALPDPGGQRPPLPHRPHHRTVPSSLLLLSLSPTPRVSVRSIQNIGVVVVGVSINSAVLVGLGACLSTSLLSWARGFVGAGK